MAHSGGPFWAKKDDYAWSMPKGEYTDGEDPFEVAKREFEEEIGQPAPKGEFTKLEPIKQSNGKIVTAWAIEKDLGEVKTNSNTFTIEWPPRSGQQKSFPEVDCAAWFEISTASKKVHPGQNELLKHLAQKLKVPFTDQSSNPNEEKLSDTQASLL